MSVIMSVVNKSHHPGGILGRRVACSVNPFFLQSDLVRREGVRFAIEGLTTAILMMFFEVVNHLSSFPPQKLDVNPSSCSTIFFTAPKSSASGVSFKRRSVQLTKAVLISLALGFLCIVSAGVSRPDAPVDEAGECSWSSSATTSSPSLSSSTFAGSGEVSSIRSGDGGLLAFLKAKLGA